MKKKARLITLLLSIVLLTFAYVNRLSLAYPFFSPQGKFAYLWNLDITKLKETKKLPQSFQSIGSIDLKIVPVGKHWLKSLTIPVKKKQTGKNHLELEILQWVLNKKYGVTINYHITDIKTGNSINEFGRTFELGDFAEISRN